MAASVRLGAWTQKPPPGARINVGHELARGLRVANIPLSATGQAAISLAGLPFGGLSGATLGTNGLDGPAFLFNSAGDYVDTGYQGFNTPAGSVVWRVFLNFSPTDSAQHDMWGAYTSSTTPLLVATKFSDNNWYIGWDSSGHDNRVSFAAGATNLVQNAWNFYAFTWGPQGSFVYLNGVQVGTSGTAPTVVSIANNFHWGNPGGNGSATGLPSGCKLDYGLIYDRQLSAGDVMTLVNQPYIMFARPRGRLSNISGSGSFSGPVVNITLAAPSPTTARTWPGPAVNITLAAPAGGRAVTYSGPVVNITLAAAAPTATRVWLTPVVHITLAAPSGFLGVVAILRQPLSVELANSVNTVATTGPNTVDIQPTNPEGVTF